MVAYGLEEVLDIFFYFLNSLRIWSTKDRPQATSWLELTVLSEVKCCLFLFSFSVLAPLLSLFSFVFHFHNLSVFSLQLCFLFLWHLCLNIFFCLHCTSSLDNAFPSLLISFSILCCPLWWLCLFFSPAYLLFFPLLLIFWSIATQLCLLSLLPFFFLNFLSSLCLVVLRQPIS